jgi:hypothetical protein
MGYNMKGYSYPGKSPAKQKGKYHYTKATKDYTSTEVKNLEREKVVTKGHNVAAEKANPQGISCLICGESRADHSYTSGHQFKSSKPPYIKPKGE